MACEASGEQSATSSSTRDSSATAMADAYRAKTDTAPSSYPRPRTWAYTRATRASNNNDSLGEIMVPHKSLKSAVAAWLAVSGLCATVAAWAADPPPPEIPICDKKIGTLAVTEPENKWWLAYTLESPEALIKVFVSQSKCFTLLDRGKGLSAAQQERALAGSGEMRGGSNIGKGQMKAADYVLVPDVVTKNNNSGGRNLGGLGGGLLGGVAGAVAGGISLKSKTADVVLTLTDVRSPEQVALQQGHSKKTDLGWGAGGGAFFGGFAAAGGASSYANTEIGQVVSM